MTFSLFARDFAAKLLSFFTAFRSALDNRRILSVFFDLWELESVAGTFSFKYCVTFLMASCALGDSVFRFGASASGVIMPKEASISSSCSSAIVIDKLVLFFDFKSSKASLLATFLSIRTLRLFNKCFCCRLLVSLLMVSILLRTESILREYSVKFCCFLDCIASLDRLSASCNWVNKELAINNFVSLFTSDSDVK